MMKVYNKLCFFYLGLLCSVFLKIYGGQVTRSGLTITTSERRIGTVRHNGSCLTITCSFGPLVGSFGRPQITELSLVKYNPKSASFNIEIDKIDRLQQQPKNQFNLYKTAGNLSRTQANLSVEVLDLQACQFGQFQCVLQFDTGPPIIAATNDQLAFHLNHTEGEWLTIVNNFIEEKIAWLSRDMVGRLYALEEKVDAGQQELKNLWEFSTEKFQTDKHIMEKALNESSQMVQSQIENLDVSTTDRMATINSVRKKAIGNLRSKVKEKILISETHLNKRIDKMNNNISKDISDLTIRMSEKISKLELETRKAVSDITNHVSSVSSQLTTELASMKHDIISSIISLQESIGKGYEDILKMHSHESTNLQRVYAQTLDSTKTSLNTLIDVLNKRVDSTNKMVRNKITVLEIESNNVIGNLKTDSNAAMQALNNTLVSELGNAEESLTNETVSVRKMVRTTSHDLSSTLSDLNQTTLANVDRFGQAIAGHTETLKTTVSFSVETLSSTVIDRVQNLGSNITQVVGDAQGKIHSVREKSSENLQTFSINSLQRVETLTSQVVNSLNLTLNNLLQNLQQLSISLTEKAEALGSGMSNNVQTLHYNTQNAINSLSEILQTHIISTTANNTEAMHELANTLMSIVISLGDKLECFENNTIMKINASTENVFKDIRDLARGIKETAVLAQQSSTQTIRDAGDTTVDHIEILKHNALQYANHVLQNTSGRISEFQNMIDNVCESISSINNNSDTKLNSLIKEGIQAIQNSTHILEERFDVRKSDFKNVKKKLQTVDNSFTDFRGSSRKSMKRLTSSSDSASLSHSKKLVNIDGHLADLEKTTVDGHAQFDDQLVEANTNLNNAENKIQEEMTSGFTDVRENIQLWEKNLTRHVKPQICHKGMPFTSLKGHRHVIIDKTPYRDFDILCDFHLDRGGWIVIQRRINGDTDFFQSWQTYKNGFGDIGGDFWLGLEKIYQLTRQGGFELHIDMMYQDRHAFARYQTFSIADERSNYELTLGEYSGTAGNSLSDAQGRGFSTFDKDNDGSSRSNCAIASVGGWWYNNCHLSNLNGLWNVKGSSAARWNTFSGISAVVSTEMKIRIK